MRCRVGDLAVIVSAAAPIYTGRFVRVVRWHKEEGGWVCEPDLEFMGQLIAWADCALRPIRDQDGEDEMLRLVGLPQKETA
jgi:hypothetical protein